MSLVKVLVNNGFLCLHIQEVIAKKLSVWHTEPPSPDDKPQPIILYYKNMMSSSYREDEKLLGTLLSEVWKI